MNLQTLPSHRTFITWNWKNNIQRLSIIILDIFFLASLILTSNLVSCHITWLAMFLSRAFKKHLPTGKYLQVLLKIESSRLSLGDERLRTIIVLFHTWQGYINNILGIYNFAVIFVYFLLFYFCFRWRNLYSWYITWYPTTGNLSSVNQFSLKIYDYFAYFPGSLTLKYLLFTKRVTWSVQIRSPSLLA